MVHLYYFQGASCGEVTGLSPSSVSGSSKLKYRGRKGWRLEFLFLSISSTWFFYCCCCSCKGKICNIPNIDYIFETGRGASLPLPPVNGARPGCSISRLGAWTQLGAWTMRLSKARDQEKLALEDKDFVFLGYSGLNTEPGDQCCFL